MLAECMRSVRTGRDASGVNVVVGVLEIVVEGGLVSVVSDFVGVDSRVIVAEDFVSGSDHSSGWANAVGWL